MTILSSAFWYWNGKINRQLKFPSPVSDLWNLQQNINFIFTNVHPSFVHHVDICMAKKSANRQGAIHFFCAKFPPLKLFPHWNEYLNTWRKKQHKYVKQFGGSEIYTNEETNVNERVLSNGGIQVVFQNLTSLLGLSLCMRITSGGGGSRPSDKGGGEGGCHLDPEITGGPVSNFFFRPFGLSFV